MNYQKIIKRIKSIEFPVFDYKIHQYPNAIGLWDNEQESLIYYALLSDPNKNWMEIGSFCGGSATLLCLTKKYLNGSAKVISVDRNFVLKHDQTSYYSFFNSMQYFPELSQTQGCDSVYLDQYYNGEELSFCFIDGWHSFKGCLTDFITVDKWIKPGGIIAIHDTQNQPYKTNELDGYYKNALKNYNEWMKEELPAPYTAKQEYHLDEVIAYIIHKYNYEYIKNPILDGTKNCIVGLLKKTIEDKNEI